MKTYKLKYNNGRQSVLNLNPEKLHNLQFATWNFWSHHNNEKHVFCKKLGYDVLLELTETTEQTKQFYLFLRTMGVIRSSRNRRSRQHQRPRSRCDKFVLQKNDRQDGSCELSHSMDKNKQLSLSYFLL